MIELFEQDLKTLDRHSSKGNQLKWKREDAWYKADYAGYEGLAEYMVSHLLTKSSLNEDQFVVYNLEKIKYSRNEFIGARSTDFLEDDWQIITLERLFKNQYNASFYESVWKIRDVKERFEFLENEVKRLTGIEEFGVYLTILLTIDAVFLNEDRHLHNIAVLMNHEGKFRLCPIFDNGASLLSDTTLDYPITADVYDLLGEVKSKTISSDFDEQLDVAESIHNKAIRFFFTKKDIDKLLDGAFDYYDKDIIERVRTVLYQQMRKYGYLFG